MTVGELIAKLDEFPNDMEVVVGWVVNDEYVGSSKIDVDNIYLDSYYERIDGALIEMEEVVIDIVG